MAGVRLLPGDGAVFASRVEATAPLKAEEKRLLDALMERPPIVFDRDRNLLTAEEPVRNGYVMVDGWAMWHEDLPDGSLQIFDFVLPGDMVGFTSLAFERQRRLRGSASGRVGASLSVTALTRVQAVPVGYDGVDWLFQAAPDLGALLLSFTAVHRSAAMRRHLTNISRRSALARTADLFLELWTRQREVGLACDDGFELPVSQATLGAMLGLTPVHVSRVVTRLRQERILTLKTSPSRKVVFHDLAAVRALAGATRGRREDELGG